MSDHAASHDLPEPRGVRAEVLALDAGAPAARFAGAAVLRWRPHPQSGEDTLQLGVPDDALGFRPRRGVRYRVLIEEEDGARAAYQCDAVWLERVQSAWWFILNGPAHADP